MDFSGPADGDGNGPDQGGGIDSGVPGRAEIDATLERILASRILAASPRQQALLRHIIIETLEGRGDRLKEFSLAVDVFGRSSAFDPRVDSIVRVQASRLRSQLTDYYAKEGAAETVRVEIPAGGGFGHPEGTRGLRRIPDPALVVRHHGPEPQHGGGRHRDAKLRQVALDIGLNELLPPREAGCPRRGSIRPPRG